MLPKFARIQKLLTIMVQTLKLVNCHLSTYKSFTYSPIQNYMTKYMHEGNLEHERFTVINDERMVRGKQHSLMGLINYKFVNTTSY